MLTEEISFSKTNECESRLNECIELESECFKGYKDCTNQLEITTQINKDLVKRLNEKNKENTISEIKVGIIAGSICLTIGIGLGVGLGIYLMKK